MTDAVELTPDELKRLSAATSTAYKQIVAGLPRLAAPGNSWLRTVAALIASGIGLHRAGTPGAMAGMARHRVAHYPDAERDLAKACELDDTDAMLVAHDLALLGLNLATDHAAGRLRHCASDIEAATMFLAPMVDEPPPILGYVIHGLHFGFILARKDLQVAGSVVGGGHRGAALAHGPAEGRATKLADIRRAVERYRRDGMSYTAATDEAGAQFGVTGRAIRKRLGPSGKASTTPR